MLGSTTTQEDLKNETIKILNTLIDQIKNNGIIVRMRTNVGSLCYVHGDNIQIDYSIRSEVPIASY